MANYQQFRVEKIASEELLTVGVNILHRAFFDGPRSDAKRRFQLIMERQPVFLLNMSLGSGNETRVTLSMERSELRGRLNFSLFRQLLGQLLANYAQELESGKPLQVFSDAQGRRLVFLNPAFCNTEQGLNALVVATDLNRMAELRLELMFLDPAQFTETAPQTEPKQTSDAGTDV